MNYEPNLIQWRRGDIVIHDYDAKRPEMLMEVIGYTRDGECRTRYCEANETNGRLIRTRRSVLNRNPVYRNPIVYLHDPARFGIAVPGREPAVSDRPIGPTKEVMPREPDPQPAHC